MLNGPQGDVAAHILVKIGLVSLALNATPHVTKPHKESRTPDINDNDYSSCDDLHDLNIPSELKI